MHIFIHKITANPSITACVSYYHITYSIEIRRLLLLTGVMVRMTNVWPRQVDVSRWRLSVLWRHLVVGSLCSDNRGGNHGHDWSGTGDRQP